MACAVEPSRRVLIVDDSDVDRERIRRLLGSHFAVLEATTAREGLDLCRTTVVDCVLLDYRLPDRDGIDLLDELVGRELPVLMLTGQGNESIAVEAMKRGALDYLVKDELLREGLRRSVNNALETIALRHQVSRQQAELRTYVAELDARRSQLERSNRKLAESEGRLRVVFEQLPALAWTTNRRLQCTSLAGSGARSLGSREAVVGSPIERLVSGGEDSEPMVAHRRALSGEPARFHAKLGDRLFDGHVEPLRIDGSIEGVIGVALDVTEARSLEQQLRHSQKMEAMGKLAGGVAHDFNNILTAIVSFARFVQQALHPDEPAYDDITEVLRASSRAESLVRQLLAFSRRDPIQPRPTDIAALATRMAPMLRRLLRGEVTLELHSDADGCTARVDPGAIEQVIVNLVVNARDAMAPGGKVTMDVNHVSFDETIGSPKRALSPGEYVQISVSDPGEGIPHEVQERIFEPFFTTKAPGQGTGLGLSTCYGIVRQAGGQILLYSEPGHGTTFKVYLPVCDTDAEAPIRAPQIATDAGTETVLLVEDDPQVREALSRMLKRSGYRVMQASDVPSAIEVASRERSNGLALLLTDVVMPGGTGADLVEMLTKMHPDLTYLYMSGYTGGVLHDRGLLQDSSDVLLQKPFTEAQLTRAVRERLDGRRGNGPVQKASP